MPGIRSGLADALSEALPEFLFRDGRCGNPQYGDRMPLTKRYEPIHKWPCYRTEGYGRGIATLGRRHVHPA